MGRLTMLLDSALRRFQPLCEIVDKLRDENIKRIVLEIDKNGDKIYLLELIDKHLCSLKDYPSEKIDEVCLRLDSLHSLIEAWEWKQNLRNCKSDLDKKSSENENLRKSLSQCRSKNEELQGEIEKRNDRIKKLTSINASPGSSCNDSLDEYSFVNNFDKKCNGVLRELSDIFPLECSNKDDIQVFCHYLNSSFLDERRDEKEKNKESLSKRSEKYNDVFRQVDILIEEVFDPKKGGSLFDKRDCMLLQLGEEAREKLLRGDKEYWKSANVGGRRVENKCQESFIKFKGCVSYRDRPQRQDVLFPGLCARCRNDDSWRLVVPAILCGVPLESPPSNVSKSKVESATRKIDASIDAQTSSPRTC